MVYFEWIKLQALIIIKTKSDTVILDIYEIEI